MANRETSFESLRANGLNAYARFRAVVTDRQLLADWRASVQQQQLANIAAFTRVAATLPEPADDLAFSAIASVAQQASDGELLDVAALSATTGRTETAELPRWFVNASIDRLAGYRSAMHDSGRRSLVAVGDFTRQSGALAMSQLLADDPDLDAVFAASDAMAEGALRALRRAGRRVPDDVAVVGFDDLPLAQHTQPPLTTVRQPLERVGAAAAQRLLAELDGTAEPYDPVLPTTLVARASA